MKAHLFLRITCLAASVPLWAMIARGAILGGGR